MVAGIGRRVVKVKRELARMVTHLASGLHLVTTLIFDAEECPGNEQFAVLPRLQLQGV